MNSNSDIEKRISEAYKAAKRAQKPNLSALSRQFNVPYQRLRARFHGRADLSSRSNAIKTLDKAQEGALIRWIDQLDSLYSSPTPAMIERAANQILQRNAETNETRTVGNAWVYRFIKRLPNDFYFINQKPKEKNRLIAEDLGLIQHWYDVLEPFISQIPPRNIYNFDETGLQLGQGKAQKVVTRRPNQALRGRPSKEIGELVSAIECIAADGSILPPYFIFKGAVHMERWYDSDIPGEYRIALSPKGYSTDLIGLDWIHHFDRHTRGRLTRKNEPRLLLFDGHGSHLTYEFLQFCGQNYIIPYCFLPHTTHLIQPLDGQPFQVYKHYYRDRNSYLAGLGVETDDKAIFLKEIPGIRDKAFKPRTIRDAFRKRGLYPFNPEEVMEPLRRAKSPTPELQIYTTPSPPPLLSSSPPSTIRGLRRSIGKAQDFINDSPELNASFIRRLNRVFQSSLETTELVGHLQNDLQLRLQYQKPQFQKKSQRRLRDNGPLTIHNAKRHIQFRSEEERQEELRRIKRARTSKRDQPTTQADTEAKLDQEASQVDKEGPKPLYWIDSQGGVE